MMLCQTLSLLVFVYTGRSTASCLMESRITSISVATNLGFRNAKERYGTMASKGASNRYGNARGGRKGHPTQHTGFLWAKDFSRKAKLRHFTEHGSDFGAKNIDEYVAKAVKFANTVDSSKSEPDCQTSAPSVLQAACRRAR